MKEKHHAVIVNNIVNEKCSIVVIFINEDRINRNNGSSWKKIAKIIPIK